MKFSDRLKEKTIKAADRNESVKMSATGVREESTDVIQGKSIPLEYQQKSYVTSNNCVWLAAALAIHSVNEEEGEKMIAARKRDPSRYEWLTVLKKKNYV